jgi:hypothetical protein
MSSKVKSGRSREQTGGYLPIEDYGMIGNMHTCALVGMDGSLDFMCWYALSCTSFITSSALKTDKNLHFRQARVRLTISVLSSLG